MGKLTSKEYKSLLDKIFKKSTIEWELQEIEDLVEELKKAFLKHKRDNPGFIKNLIRSKQYYSVPGPLANAKESKFEEALDQFISELQESADEINEVRTDIKSVKLKWNGTANQLYFLIRQLMTLKTNEDDPYLANSALEIAEFISQNVEGIQAKPSSISSALTRKEYKPAKGKKLTITIK